MFKPKFRFFLILVAIALFSLLPIYSNAQDQKSWGELTNMAYMYSKADQYQEALRLTKLSLTLPGHQEDYLSLANLSAIYKKLGDNKSAEDILQKIQSKRINLEKEAEKQERLYKEMKKNAGITESGGLPLGPVSEKDDELLSLRYTISIYQTCETNAKQGKVVHTHSISQPVLYPPGKNYKPEKYITKTYYDSGKLWKEYIYEGNVLVGLKIFDKKENLVFDETIDK